MWCGRDANASRRAPTADGSAPVPSPAAPHLSCWPWSSAPSTVRGGDYHGRDLCRADHCGALVASGTHTFRLAWPCMWLAPRMRGASHMFPGRRRGARLPRSSPARSGAYEPRWTTRSKRRRTTSHHGLPRRRRVHAPSEAARQPRAGRQDAVAGGQACGDRSRPCGERDHRVLRAGGPRAVRAVRRGWGPTTPRCRA
jgi:hypothetical protein